MKDIGDVIGIITNYLGYKANIQYCNREEREVVFVMYDSFLFRCGFDKPHDTFKCGLRLNEHISSIKLLGKTFSLNSDEQSIKNSLQMADDYCRLRLPDKFLEAYYKAHVLSQYGDCDL